MKKFLSVLVMTIMVIGSVSAGTKVTVADPGAPWPKIRLKWTVTIMLNMHSYLSNCEFGDGFCFFIGFGSISDDPVKMMAAEMGPTDDGKYLAVKLNYESVKVYEDGNFLSRFQNKRSLTVKEEIHIPDAVWRKLDMDPIVYRAGSYNLVEQDGSFYVMFPLQ
ncbi:MAG: hypothetical protein WC151_07300 [Bacteroidales bacterium]